MQIDERRVHGTRLLACGAMLFTAFAPAAPAAPEDARGRLVVLVVVDQLRYHDLLQLSPELGPQGFAGLGEPSPMRYETALNETAVGHATLSTGAYADVHGVVGNRIRAGDELREAVVDPQCPVWGRSDVGRSAGALRAPTVGDALKLATHGKARVVSVAMKDRSALFLAGSSADVALFWDADRGELTSTACIAPGPPPWLEALQARHPAAEWKDWAWTPSRPEAVMARYADEKARPVPREEIGASFPHQVGQGDVGPRLFKALRNTPAGTTIVLRAARAAVEALSLGNAGGSDLLLVAIATADTVGHSFGTASRERADAVLRAHDELLEFIGFLRGRLGRRVAVVLTSDHGVTPTGATAAALHAGGRVIERSSLESRVNRALDEQLGPASGGWVSALDDATLLLRRKPGVDPERAAQIAAAALREEPGLWRVVPASEAPRAETIVRHAYFPGRSGDVIFVLAPLVSLRSPEYAATHASPWNDDALIPFQVRAPGFRLRPELRGRALEATQVAPALAALLGIAPPAAALADSPLVADAKAR